jgi:hypothetical protein
VGGIKLANSVGEYYDNYIETECEGIKMGRTLDNPGTRYFNNIVVGAKCGAITTPEDGAMVYNNTVVNGEPYGISATGKNAQVFDNIIAGTAGASIDGLDTNFMNNWIGPVSSAGFVNPDSNDYHLSKDSPMIGMGRSIGVFPQFDMDGVSRPIGFMTDLGAYEYPIPFDYLYVPLLLTNRP